MAYIPWNAQEEQLLVNANLALGYEDHLNTFNSHRASSKGSDCAVGEIEEFLIKFFAHYPVTEQLRARLRVLQLANLLPETSAQVCLYFFWEKFQRLFKQR